MSINFLKQSSLLPAGYQEVEYITSDGNQLINTNAKLATNSKYQFEVEFTSNNDIRWFGNYQSDSNDLVLAFKNGYIPCRINKQWDDNYLTTISLNQKHLIEVETNSSGIKIYCDGVLHKEVSIAYAPNTNLNIGFLKEYSLTKPGLIGNLYSCQMLVNDVLTRNYIPCYRILDGVIGLYDSVSDQFYTNVGTGTFVKGPLVYLPPEYQRVEYIESTGTQYIDTGVSPNNNTGLKVIFSDLTVETRDFNFIGCRLTGSSRFMINYTDGNFGYGWDSYYTTNENINMSAKNTAELNFYNSRNFIANGNTLANLSTISISDMPTIYIFGQHAVNSNNIKAYKAYECEITQDNLLIRKFVPCYRKSDNVIGMYDTVNNIFYTNTGTGTFLKGNDVLTPEQESLAFIEDDILPVEYQKVEYIESTGTQYIDTGFVPKVTTKVEIRLSLTELSQVALLGSWNNTTDSRWQLFYVTSSSKLTFGYGSEGQPYGISINTNQLYDISMNVADNKVNLKIDSDVWSYNTPTFVESNYNLFLFGRNVNGSSSSLAKMKLYNCKIYDNGVLVRNFIPCYRKSDNEIGMYDTVGKQFYTNAGTGTFTKGSNLSYSTNKYKMVFLKKSDNLLKLTRNEWNSVSYQPTSTVTFDYNKLYYMAGSGYIRPKENSLNETITNNSVTFTATNSSWWGIGFPIEVKPNTKYTISLKRTDGNKTKPIYTIYNADGTFSRYSQVSTNVSLLDITNTITTGATETTLIIVIAGITQGDTVYAYDIQVEEGQTATAFKPYGYITTKI